MRVIVDDEEWSGWSMKKPLERPTVSTAVPGVMPGCDDVDGDGQGAGPDEQVTLNPIEGVPPDQALFLPDHDLNDQILVPGMDVTFASLPPEVQELLHER